MSFSVAVSLNSAMGDLASGWRSRFLGLNMTRGLRNCKQQEQGGAGRSGWVWCWITAYERHGCPAGLHPGKPPAACKLCTGRRMCSLPGGSPGVAVAAHLSVQLAAQHVEVVGGGGAVHDLQVMGVG